MKIDARPDIKRLHDSPLSSVVQISTPANTHPEIRNKGRNETKKAAAAMHKADLFSRMQVTAAASREMGKLLNWVLSVSLFACACVYNVERNLGGRRQETNDKFRPYMRRWVTFSRCLRFSKPCQMSAARRSSQTVSVWIHFVIPTYVRLTMLHHVAAGGIFQFSLSLRPLLGGMFCSSGSSGSLACLTLQ